MDLNQLLSLAGAAAGWVSAAFAAVTVVLSIRDERSRSHHNYNLESIPRRLFKSVRFVLTKSVESILTAALSLWIPDPGRLPDPTNNRFYARTIRKIHRIGIQYLPKYRTQTEWPAPGLFPPPETKGKEMLWAAFTGLLSNMLLLFLIAPAFGGLRALLAHMDPSTSKITGYVGQALLFSPFLMFGIKSWQAMGWKLLRLLISIAIGFTCLVVTWPTLKGYILPIRELQEFQQDFITIILGAFAILPMFPFEDSTRRIFPQFIISTITHLRVSLFVFTIFFYILAIGLLR